MAFDGKEGEVVSLTEAAAWTANYRSAYPNSVKAHFAGKDNINSILNQTGCVGVRMYHGIDDDDQQVLILVGVNADERDMTSGIIVERLPFCPPVCDPNSSLNG